MIVNKDEFTVDRFEKIKYSVAALNGKIIYKQSSFFFCNK